MPLTNHPTGLQYTKKRSAHAGSGKKLTVHAVWQSFRTDGTVSALWASSV
jgi:hypothetical protein